MRDLALSINGFGHIDTPPGIGTYTISTLLSTAVTILFIVAIVLTLFFLIYAGIDMITAGGEKQKVVNARNKLTFAVVGLIIVFLSYFIVNLIGTILGVNLLSTTP